MSGHLPRISGIELLKILSKFGFYAVRQRGSHVTVNNTNLNPPIAATVPLHKEIALGTLKSILRQMHISEDEFLKAYND